MNTLADEIWYLRALNHNGGRILLYQVINDIDGQPLSSTCYYSSVYRLLRPNSNTLGPALDGILAHSGEAQSQDPEAASENG